MTVTDTTLSNFGTVVQKAIQTQLEENLRNALPFMTPESWIPAVYQRGTSAMVFQSFADIAANGQTLTEGVPPTPDAMAMDSDTITPVEMGHTIEITNRANLYSPANLIGTATERLARNAAEELQLVIKTALDSCAVIVYSGGASSTAGATATISAAAIKKMYGLLQERKVPLFPDGLYRAVISPRVAYDIAASASGGEWTDIKKYAAPADLLSNEIGSAYGFRFLVSNIVTTATTAGGGGVDVLNSYFFGPRGYAVGDVTTFRSTFTDFTPSKSDPLGQLAYLGWRAFYGAKLLSAAGSRVALYKSGATILTTGTDH